MKRRIVSIIDLADKLDCLLMPKLRFLWRFACGHEELRTHRTRSGNGSRNGRCYGICKQCSCLCSK